MGGFRRGRVRRAEKGRGVELKDESEKQSWKRRGVEGGGRKT